MVPKTLTEKGWIDIASSKFKGKDERLRDVLRAFQKLKEDQNDERLKAIGSVIDQANTLKTVKEVKDAPDVVKYLNTLVKDATSEEAKITKAADLAEKAAKAEAIAKDKAEADKEQKEKKEDPLIEHYKKVLAINLAKVKNNAGVSFEYIICLSDSGNNVMVAPAINSQLKAELSKVTNNSRRFLPPDEPGKCRFENGKFTFDVPKIVPGLKVSLEESLLKYTEKPYKVKVGAESEEDDEAEEGGAK